MVATYTDGIPLNDDRNNVNAGRPTNGSLTVDDHFAFFKQICDYANEYYVVQKAKDVYGGTKHSFRLLERTLDKVENGAHGALDYTAPLYENYVYPTTNGLISTFNKSLKGTKSVADKSKSIVITSGTVTIGLALVVAQMGLIIGSSATRLFMDGLINTKKAGDSAYSSAIACEKSVERSIRHAIESSFELAKNPSTKITEHANTFLDVANAVFERIFGLPQESENPENTLVERVKFLAARIARKVTNTTNTQIVEPCQRKIAAVADQLHKSFTLVDYLKQKREWTFQQVDNLSSSVHEYRKKVEEEAKLAVTKPEDVLIRSIHSVSKTLGESLVKLRETGAQILSEKLQNNLNNSIEYVGQLTLTFEKAEDIYQVKDEVVVEAMNKLTEISKRFQTVN